ncbi:LysR substrate-binding domain-containing protein [Roseibium suaedae]|uniref:DNA-binding transcriptional regulator, LysR family n=1 Tax=Roseibium suaedae TaxID=735517 RepID=A0A1M7KHN5_9HYPH|nr:LysR substrate-binding domain-containing protein [Roseibium suaedae]SHM64843.1 DNA-binding transcriptional regulator, LysR family [Roseibium suaedae]
MSNNHGTQPVSQAFKPTDLPSLAVLRCFEAAARHESFTAAAEDLSLTQGAISRHVRDLEEHVDAALFRREGRGVRLTDAGRTLAASLSGDLDRLRRTITHAIAAGDTRQTLSIATLPTFGARWLVPRLQSFKGLEPDVELVLYSRSEPFDIAASGIDAAIHFGSADWPGAQLTPLCPEGLVAVVAPALAGHGEAVAPADLLALPLLHISSRPYLWDQFGQSLGGTLRPLRKGSTFDQFSLVIAAAIAGLGAAIIPRYLIETEIASGALLEVAKVPPATDKAYFIATPSGTRNPLAAQFISWIKGQVTTRARMPERR